MTQRTDIANIALSMLGEEPITSIEDETRIAQAVKTNYTIARDATLEAHEWSFATKRFEPSKLATAPLWGYSTQFALPPECLRLTAVERDFVASVPPQIRSGPRTRNQVDHVVEGRAILCNEDSIQCTGIFRIENEGLFSNLFVHAFAAKLAILVCYAVTESNSKFDRVGQMYEQFMREAKSRDGSQSSTRRMRNHSLRRVR